MEAAMGNKIRNDDKYHSVKSSLNNRGFSLIELLVTVIILLLLVAVVTFGISTAKYADVKRCSKNIEQKMSQLRLLVMSSKNQEYLVIYQAADKNYYMAVVDNPDDVCSESDGEKIGNTKLHIAGITSSDTIGVSFTDNKRIILSFHKSSGAFIAVGGNLYQKIEIVNEDIKYRINLVKETGKFYTKQVN